MLHVRHFTLEQLQLATESLPPLERKWLEDNVELNLAYPVIKARVLPNPGHVVECVVVVNTKGAVIKFCCQGALFYSLTVVPKHEPIAAEPMRIPTL